MMAGTSPSLLSAASQCCGASARQTYAIIQYRSGNTSSPQVQKSIKKEAESHWESCNSEIPVAMFLDIL